jgi:hypothetical protein
MKIQLRFVPKNDYFRVNAVSPVKKVLAVFNRYALCVDYFDVLEIVSLDTLVIHVKSIDFPSIEADSFINDFDL